MTRRNWKCVIPHSMVKALVLTKEHGIEKKNMSVQRIADRLSTNDDCLYKWIANATMPISKVIAFEEVCGRPIVTQYLAQSQGYLLVPVPTGRKAEHKEINELQLYMTRVLAKIIEANEKQCTAEQAIDFIKVLMHDLAFQERNVAANDIPQDQFDLSDQGAK